VFLVTHQHHFEDQRVLVKNQLAEYVSACFTGLSVQSHEQEEALREIAKMCRKQE
jgi:hypothetical protein